MILVGKMPVLQKRSVRVYFENALEVVHLLVVLGWPVEGERRRIPQGLEIPLDKPPAEPPVHVHVTVRETQDAAVVPVPNADGVHPLLGLGLNDPGAVVVAPGSHSAIKTSLSAGCLMSPYLMQGRISQPPLGSTPFMPPAMEYVA